MSQDSSAAISALGRLQFQPNLYITAQADAHRRELQVEGLSDVSPQKLRTNDHSMIKNEISLIADTESGETLFINFSLHQAPDPEDPMNGLYGSIVYNPAAGGDPRAIQINTVEELEALLGISDSDGIPGNERNELLNDAFLNRDGATEIKDLSGGFAWVGNRPVYE